MAAVGGAAAGGAAYALEGVNLEPKYKAGILLAGGAVLGLLASGFSKPVGAGLAGAGVGLGVKALLDIYMAKKAATSGLGAIPGYAVNRFGIPQQSYHHLPYAAHPQMGAVQADLGGLGAVQAQMSAVQATLV
jgi:hypothetical protein